MEIILFLIGGGVYALLEIFWRGYTHWTMFLLGGVCFVVMGLLNEYKIPRHWCLLRQSIVSACVITALEFVVGYIVNIRLGWQVWDYSDLPFNLYGQICLYYFLLWIFLSAAGIVFDDWIRYIVYIQVKKWSPWTAIKKREKPKYKFV